MRYKKTGSMCVQIIYFQFILVEKKGKEHDKHWGTGQKSIPESWGHKGLCVSVVNLPFSPFFFCNNYNTSLELSNEVY